MGSNVAEWWCDFLKNSQFQRFPQRVKPLLAIAFLVPPSVLLPSTAKAATSNRLPVSVPDIEDIPLTPSFQGTPIPETQISQVQPPPNVPNPSALPGNLQSDPNSDRFLQSPPLTPTTPPIQPTPTPTPPIQSTPPTAEPSTPPAVDAVQVERIEVTGSTIFNAENLNPITQPLVGKSATSEQLAAVADAITQLYLNQGYITSRAVVSQINGGIVQIRVIEGSIERIDVEGANRVNPDYIRSRVRLGAGTPLNTGKLEDQLRLLRVDPLFSNVEASLRRGTGLGQSILVVRVIEGRSFFGNIGIDNYSPPSVGSERIGLNLGYRNLTGNGDAIALFYTHTTTSGADAVDLSYQIPLNPMNGTLQLRTSLDRNKITQPPFDVFDIGGNSQLYEISFRQPLMRSPREELALSGGFTYQEGQTFLFNNPFGFGFGPDENGNSRTSIFKFGQDYVRRDVSGAWSLRSQFSFGTGLLNATRNGDLPDGQFISWLGQVQRVQILDNNNLLIVQGDVQLASDSLLASQQFVIGGGQSLRGYRQNARSGDNGFRFSIEDRYTLERDANGASTFILAPFIDAGLVWNHSGNPNTLPSQTFLAGIGLGAIWLPLPKLNIRLDYGYPLIELDDRGENAQDEGFYFSVNYQL